jgi:adenylate cyclase
MNPGLPEEQSFTLPDEGAITIGRTKDNDLYCLHKSLSRKHARVERNGRNSNRVSVSDLQSKNGVFFNGKRVVKCEVGDGESFRCGDITFLVEGSTARHQKGDVMAASAIAQTLPSPFALEGSASKRPTKVPAQPQVIVEDDTRYKDKLFLIIRATELLVGEISVDKVLEEIVVLAVQVLEVDRISLLTLDETSGEMKPRVLKTFVAASARPFSKRVVDWVVDHGSPASFADVARDNTLPGSPNDDRHVRAAMCVPIDPGGGTIGVLYADSLSQSDCFRPDDLALLRALANLAAVTIEGAALRADRRPMPSRI